MNHTVNLCRALDESYEKLVSKDSNESTELKGTMEGMNHSGVHSTVYMNQVRCMQFPVRMNLTRVMCKQEDESTRLWCPSIENELSVMHA
jgi:hypothetical protein